MKIFKIGPIQLIWGKNAEGNTLSTEELALASIEYDFNKNAMKTLAALVKDSIRSIVIFNSDNKNNNQNPQP